MENLVVVIVMYERKVIFSMKNANLGLYTGVNLENFLRGSELNYNFLRGQNIILSFLKGLKRIFFHFCDCQSAKFPYIDL